MTSNSSNKNNYVSILLDIIRKNSEATTYFEQGLRELQILDYIIERGSRTIKYVKKAKLKPGQICGNPGCGKVIVAVRRNRETGVLQCNSCYMKIRYHRLKKNSTKSMKGAINY